MTELDHEAGARALYDQWLMARPLFDHLGEVEKDGWRKLSHAALAEIERQQRAHQKPMADFLAAQKPMDTETREALADRAVLYDTAPAGGPEANALAKIIWAMNRGALNREHVWAEDCGKAADALTALAREKAELVGELVAAQKFIADLDVLRERAEAAEARVAELEAVAGAARDLVRLVEGPLGWSTSTNAVGVRLKDTEYWVRLFLASAALSPPAQGDGTSDWYCSKCHVIVRPLDARCTICGKREGDPS